MIGGYFAYESHSDPQKFKRKILKLLKIIILTEVLYGAFDLLVACALQGQPVADFIRNMPLANHPVRILFFGTAFNGTLWYLYAALWTWCIYLLLAKREILARNTVYILVPLLVIAHVFGRLYVQNHYNISENIYLFRSVLLFGLPMTLLGSWIRKNRERLLQMVSVGKAVLIILIGGAVSIAEYFISHRLFAVSGMDFHISTVIISFGLFMLALPFQTVKHRSFTRYIGDKLSMWIYLSHMFCGSVLGLLGQAMGIAASAAYLYLRPIMALCLCCLIAVGINEMKAYHKKYRLTGNLSGRGGMRDV